MEVCSNLEISIPKEAEVKNIPLKSLPNSVLRRIGLPVSDGDPTRKPTAASDVVWICPAVVGRKGQESVSCKGENLAESPLTFLRAELKDRPLKMSFVSSNRAAWDVLLNISTGKGSSKKELLREDSVLPANQPAVFIYNRQVYLLIRKARRQQKTGELQLSSQAAIPSTSGLQSTSSTKELISGRLKTRADTAGVKHCEKAAVLKRKGGSTVRAEYSDPCPSGTPRRADSKYVKAPRKESSSEETAPQPDSIQPEEMQKKPTSRESEGEYVMDHMGEEEGFVWSHDTDHNPMDGQNQDRSDSRGWTLTEILGAAPASTSKHLDYDYSELEQDEKIAQLTAKFLNYEAALNNYKTN